MSPHFPLPFVREAAKSGVVLGRSRASQKLFELLGELLLCQDFAEAVLRELEDSDFVQTKVLADDERFDEYGRRVSDALLSKFGIDVVAWYLKLTVRQTATGENVFMLSLHPLEHPIMRVGGRLWPNGRMESNAHR